MQTLDRKMNEKERSEDILKKKKIGKLNKQPGKATSVRRNKILMHLIELTAGSQGWVCHKCGEICG